MTEHEEDIERLKKLMDYAEYLTYKDKKPYLEMANLFSSVYLSFFISSKVPKNEFAKALIDLNKKYAEAFDQVYGDKDD